MANIPIPVGYKYFKKVYTHMNIKNNYPLVSIIIPCYNSASYISECIQSVLNQDYPNIEVIIVDDGSSDESINIIKKFPNIKLISQKNSGACVARNNGLQISQGYFIKFLDSDDYLEPGIIRRQVELSLKLKDHYIVYGDYYRLTHHKTIYEKNFLERDNQTALLILNDILIATPLHKKWMLTKIGGFDERFKSGQEWNLHIRLANEGFIFYHHNQATFYYRIHDSEQRISNKRKKSSAQNEYEIKKLEMTIENINENISDNINAAISMKYWWIARSFFRSGNYKQSMACLALAKSLSNKYDLYWPSYYKYSYKFLKFHMSETLFLLAYLFKNKFDKSRF